MAEIGFVKSHRRQAKQDKEPSRKAHVCLFCLGVIMGNTKTSSKNWLAIAGTEPHPEALLPPLCRIEHVLTVVPIGRSTVWLWARQGRFPQPFKFGSITLWKREDVLAWLRRTGGEK